MTATDLQQLRRGSVELISELELKAKLALGRQLIIKAGFDPTTPELHLGHTVLFRKLRHFQDLGHKVIFLIGDATGLVGDPSGQSQARKLLTWDDVRVNAQTYQQQIKSILLTDRKVYEVRYNSEWFLGRSPQMRSTGLETFDFSKWVQLASKYTVARLTERDDFSTRLKAGKPLSMLELFYPLMQGYDSVKIAEQYGHCDVEIGGTDQKFNLLVGRDLLKEYGHEPQVVMTMPLLEGLDGVNKMSKSLGNHVAINDPPEQMFGKLMSVSDSFIAKYLTLLTDTDEAAIKEIERQLAARAINPRDAKAGMAHTVVAQYHGADAAERAQQEFAKVFSRREVPTDMPVVTLPSSRSAVDVVELLVSQGVAKTKNEARRLLTQGAVKVAGAAIQTPVVTLDPSVETIIQVGSRHFLKVKFQHKDA